MELPHKHFAARIPPIDPDSSPIALTSKPLLAYVLTISLCAFPLGWDLGTTGNLLDLPSFRARLGVSAQVTGLLISAFNVGCICACSLLFMLKASRKVGHLLLLRLCLVLFLIGACISFCCLIEGPSNVYLFSVGRFVQGISAGTLCVIGPMFISHLSTFSDRTIIFYAVFQIVIGSFVFFGNCFFIYTGRLSELGFLIISVALPLFALACLTILPESPLEAWILSDPKRFRHIVGRLLEDTEKEDIWLSALHILKAQHIGQETYVEDRKINGRRLSVCCILLFLQQMTGANFFFYFGKTMFDLLIVVNSSMKFSGLLLSLCNLAGIIIFCFLVRLKGSRVPLFYGLISLSLLLFTFASMGTISLNSGSTRLGIPMLVSSCCILFVFAMSWGPCTAVICMEISQADERILSCSVICGWATNVLVVSLFPLLVDQLGLGAMYVFLVCTVILVWVTHKDYSEDRATAG